MAKNRKAESAVVRLGPAVKAMFFCGFIAASGVGYVWQKSQVQALGDEIAARETRLAEIQRQNKEMRQHLEKLCLPSVLESRVRALNLGLIRTAVNQVVRLYESPPAGLPPEPSHLAFQMMP